jgi:NAD(P)-dependent dehydrogenase (short-subunit alcohol dehydrogenase family)
MHMLPDQLFALAGKTALVTGASGGIGEMIARGLVQRGVRTFITGRKADSIEAVAAALSAQGECTAIVADVGTDEGRERLVAALAGEDRLDLLVNNAGTSYAAPVEAFSAGKFERVLRVNLSSPFGMVSALLPKLRCAAGADAHASVINIASIDAFRLPLWESHAYAASKAGLAHMTRHLARSLAADNITVNAIAPGLFPSAMTRFLFDEDHPHHQEPQQIPLRREGRPDDIVGGVVYLASPAGAYVTGVVLPISGGLATAE